MNHREHKQHIKLFSYRLITIDYKTGILLTQKFQIFNILYISYNFYCWFSCSVMSNYLQPYGLMHARHPCPSLSPGACSNSCLLSRWSHPTISSSVIPFSSCLQSFPASQVFSIESVQYLFDFYYWKYILKDYNIYMYI